MNLVFLVLLYLFKALYASSPTVKVEQGELFGKKYSLPNGKIIYAFRGIPYASPPIANNRFKDPQKLNPWNDIWNATFHRSECIQLSYVPKIIYKIRGEEDCLYLNIYTPQLPANGKNPLLNVFAFIHGGAFTFGSGNVLPDRILTTNDVVFISINYRLGVLGFLSSNDDNIPGNFGLKDQVAALKWIKQNVINFGGNPDSITIAGHSSGAVSVHYHLLSPLSEGLFQKAISFSGTVFLPWALSKHPFEKSLRLASLVGCPVINTQKMVKCLRQKPPTDLVEASKNFMTWRFAPLTLFGPVIEPISENAFLRDDPFNLIKNGKIKDIPWMAGMVKDEGLVATAEFIDSDVYLKELNDNWNKIVPNLIIYNDTVPENKKDEISQKIRKFYFGEKFVSKETYKELSQMTGDRIFYNGIIDGIQLHNIAINSKLYCSKFNYRGEKSIANALAGNNINYGVSHGDDSLYLIKKFPDDELHTESDLAVSKLLTSTIADFMNSGNPNKIVSNWKPVKKESNTNLDCLFINSNTDLKMGKIPTNSPSKQFWKTTIPWENPIFDESSSYKKLAGTFCLMFLVYVIIKFAS